ncbi:MAG: metallophosphoesterase family protein [Actinomycetota bacterium]
MRIGVISDTHIGPPGGGRPRTLPPAVFDVFAGADAILHAGDVLVGDVLVELGAIAPVHAVLGNGDHWDLRGRLPERARLELGGLTIGMIHDSGSTEGRRRRMEAAFSGCRVVVFGHSHMPVVDDDGSLLLLNPGSALQPRRAKVPTVALLEIHDGVPTAALVELPAPPA